jgi:alpha-mannosidase
LIKSGIYPYEEADKEIHEFTYSIYPHRGDWKRAGTDRMAYSLNCPMYEAVEDAHNGSLPDNFSALKVDSENVKVEVVKKAEDSDDIIIRLYEYQNRRARVTLEFFRHFSEVWECNLMETDITKINHNETQFSFDILPYEIKTFKFRIE